MQDFWMWVALLSLLMWAVMSLAARSPIAGAIAASLGVGFSFGYGWLSETWSWLAIGATTQETTACTMALVTFGAFWVMLGSLGSRA